MNSERIRVGLVADFKKKNSISFLTKNGSKGFVVYWKDQFFAYKNLCRHLPLPLDGETGRFFSMRNDLLLCQNHGAEYDPASGLCIHGPCRGASLYPIKVIVEKSGIWIEPESENSEKKKPKTRKRKTDKKIISCAVWF